MLLVGSPLVSSKASGLDCLFLSQVLLLPSSCLLATSFFPPFPYMERSYSLEGGEFTSERSHFIALRPTEGPALLLPPPRPRPIPCEKTSLPGGGWGGGEAVLLEPKESDIQTSSAESVSPKALGSLLSMQHCGHPFPRPPALQQRDTGTQVPSDSHLHAVPGLSLLTRGT